MRAYLMCFTREQPYFEQAVPVFLFKYLISGDYLHAPLLRQLGRKCYMMELDTHYCDVIIARWEKLTGQKAKLLTNTKTAET